MIHGRLKLTPALALLLSATAFVPCARAAERVTLRTGFQVDCTHTEHSGDHVRIYLLPDASTPSSQSPASPAPNPDANYIEVAAASILRVEAIPNPIAAPAPAASVSPHPSSAPQPAILQHVALTPNELHQLLARAGELHDIDADLLASVVHAESGGNARAVSRAGAQGLMQLMPTTASDLGVHNSFAPDQNIGGGTAYLDALLTRYHDNLALALAAYNAGPAAVDRYHGIPPYAETRAYVARVIREFNRRKRAARSSASALVASAN